MALHVLGASVWLGALVAYVGLVRQGVDHLPVIARRYRVVAAVAFAAVAVSGIVAAWVGLTFFSDLWTTGYGRLALVKAAALLAAGILGHRQRRRAPVAGRGIPLIRSAGWEAVVLAAAVGVSAVLARTAAPAPTGILPTVAVGRMIDTLGYPLAGPTTPTRLLLDWRADLVVAAAVVLALGCYLGGVHRLRRRGDPWPVSRTAAWCAGWLLILFVTSSGLGRYAPSQFSLELVRAVLLGTSAPALLVLGAPVRLLQRSVVPGRDRVPGLFEAVTALLDGPVLRVLTRPVPATALFAGWLPILCFTGLFPLPAQSHLARLAVDVGSVLVGCLFFATVSGRNLVAARRAKAAATAQLLAALLGWALFGLVLARAEQPLAESYYRHLDLPWASDPLADQHLGATIGAGVACFCILIALAVLISRPRSPGGDGRGGPGPGTGAEVRPATSAG